MNTPQDDDHVNPIGVLRFTIQLSISMADIMPKSILLICILCYAPMTEIFSQTRVPRVVRDDFKRHFEQFGVNGAIIVFDRNANREYVYREAMTKTRYSPASTFKIFNSLVGLDSKIIPDTSYMIPWDSVQRGRYAPWHRANSLKSAFKYSVVWYYQELARRVGEKKMKKYIKANRYGNMDTREKVDEFWLADKGGKLRISMEEQIDFLQKLYDEKLKFSRRSQQLVKAIMLDEESTNEYQLYGKTGAANYEGMSYGWYVGWIAFKDNIYFVATFIESSNPEQILNGGRKGITLAAFEDLKD